MGASFLSSGNDLFLLTAHFFIDPAAEGFSPFQLLLSKLPASEIEEKRQCNADKCQVKKNCTGKG